MRRKMRNKIEGGRKREIGNPMPNVENLDLQFKGGAMDVNLVQNLDGKLEKDKDGDQAKYVMLAL